jgi:hypothetical protein
MPSFQPLCLPVTPPSKLRSGCGGFLGSATVAGRTDRRLPYPKDRECRLAAFIIETVLIYAAIGAVLAVTFLLWGIDRLDPAAAGAYAFRPLLMPGLVLLWPLVAARWIALERRR